MPIGTKRPRVYQHEGVVFLVPGLFASRLIGNICSGLRIGDAEAIGSKSHIALSGLTHAIAS